MFLEHGVYGPCVNTTAIHSLAKHTKLPTQDRYDDETRESDHHAATDNDKDIFHFTKLFSREKGKKETNPNRKKVCPSPREKNPVKIPTEKKKMVRCSRCKQSSRGFWSDLENPTAFQKWRRRRRIQKAMGSDFLAVATLLPSSTVFRELIQKASEFFENVAISVSWHLLASPPKRTWRMNM